MRLDLLLSDKLGVSRTRAQNLIKTGGVKVAGTLSMKPSAEVAPDADVSVTDTLKYASLGGLKLENAIEKLSLELTNAVCLDVGAANGGFTDCMLSYGAKKVFAVDLTIAFPERLLKDKRVRLYDGINVKNLSEVFLEDRFDFISTDLSFISVCSLFPILYPLLKTGGKLLILFKPQFEVGRKALPKSGVVRDKKVIEKAFGRVIEAAQSAGFEKVGDCPIPDVFPDKNPERTVLFIKSL